MKSIIALVCCCTTLAFAQEIAPEDVIPMEEMQGPSVQEFYSYMQEAMDDGDWWSAIDFGELVLYHFPDSPFGEEIPFFIGMAYYKLGQQELANIALSDYLKGTAAPKHFEEAIETKFAIAEFFRQGGKKRLFGSHKLPAIIPAKEDAIEIYDEVITTLPHHDMAARAMLGKAEVQAYYEDFKPSVETLCLLIRRFPKHGLAAEAYLQINRVYLEQCKSQHLDPDLLDLAEVNLRKFRLAFPRDNRIQLAEEALADMQEVFAENLLETGDFFNRRKQYDASIIYYSKVVAKYPKTKAATAAHENFKYIRRTVSFSFLLLVGCGYQWASVPEHRTISIPYATGDEDGRLTAEIITAFGNSFATVVRKGGQYELRIEILDRQRDTIGFRIDRQQIKGKSKKNIVADEERTTLTVEVTLYETGRQDPVIGPERFIASVDYDFVDGDSYRDLTFVDSQGNTQTVLAFSLGQLESTETAREAATRPLYSKIAKSIVDSISARW